ncbi:hypothetical protein JMM63_05935 [Rhodovulum sulfidophilum]|uniref:hypothetical protein n=1 Tax=Rhodovulum sulfidophilum TaxID=35806 RepID=UPI001920A4BF|nr:hypothetical protein [Rhodovulum sulfidophilum]MBL3595108.1 hypothetical protein [Rhodovulum sulfidophilum]
MEKQSTSQMLRSDDLLRAAGEKNLEAFKYLAGVCWAPVVVAMAFLRGGGDESGWFVKLALSGALAALMVAGAIFFLAFHKQTMAFVHSLMGSDALDIAKEVNPNAEREISSNSYIAYKLGHVADRVAFPMMTVSYGVISFVAIAAVWR